MAGREITKWDDVTYTRNRFFNDLSMDMPKSIATKELLDNGLDQIGDRKTANCSIDVDIPNGCVQVMDGGAGISLRKNSEGQTHLFLAVSVLHSSDNYDATDGSQSKTTTVGLNGVGSSINNFLSKTFICGPVKGGKLKGYIFHDGYHANNGEQFDTVLAGQDGGEFEWVEFPYDQGYYVAADYDETILHFDDVIQGKFITDYVRGRVGELPEGADVHLTVRYEDHVDKLHFTKIPGDADYVKSWDEQVADIPGAQVMKAGGWTYAFGTEENAGDFAAVTNVVMNSPVQNSSTLKAKFDVEEYQITIGIPYAFKYTGRTIPRYTDQTKRKVTIISNNVMKAIQRNKALWNHYYREAERVYLAEKLKQTTNHMSSYWPAVGREDGYREVFICEGYSAASGVKNQRFADTQAVVALRGKVLNCRNKKLKDALKSDVINHLFTILTNNHFDKIIITTDADEDGRGHIAMLIIGLIEEYMPHIIREGKLYLCDVPAFVCTKKGQPFIGVQDVQDCPAGYEAHPKKGLGSMTGPETRHFITDRSTRKLLRLTAPDNMDEVLDTALVTCGAEWIG